MPAVLHQPGLGRVFLWACAGAAGGARRLCAITQVRHAASYVYLNKNSIFYWLEIEGTLEILPPDVCSRPGTQPRRRRFLGDNLESQNRLLR